MPQERITRHKFVRFTYRIVEPESGRVLEQVDLPIAYVHGADSGLLERLERALEGKVVGDQVEVLVPPEEAFGPHDPALTYTDDIENVPPQFRHVGAEVEMMNDAGDVRTFIVSKIENGKLTVDGNHPLAGKTLRYIVQVQEVRDATPQEIREGRPGMAGPVLH